MKRHSRETLFMSLSAILLLILGVIYLTQGNRYQRPEPKRHVTIVSSSSSSSSSTVAKTDDSLKAVTKQLEALEKDPTAEGLKTLQDNYKKLANSTGKTALNSRLTALEQTVVAQEKAKEALVLAQTTGLWDDILTAQELITNLAESSVKTELTNQLTLLIPTNATTVPNDNTITSGTVNTNGIAQPSNELPQAPVYSQPAVPATTTPTTPVTPNTTTTETDDNSNDLINTPVN